jgi:hypothetical protein
MLIRGDKSLLLLTLIALSISFSTGFSGGSGTSSDPYHITSCDELNDTEEYFGAEFEVVTSIDCFSEEDSVFDYRIQHTLDTNYSKITVSEDSEELFLVNVENKGTSEKELTTYLSGVNAYFNDNSEPSKSYFIDGGETRQFLTTVEPESPGQKSLEVTTEIYRANYNITDEFTVNVREEKQATETRDVPGVTGLQLLVAMLLSVLLYYPRL